MMTSGEFDFGCVMGCVLVMVGNRWESSDTALPDGSWACSVLSDTRSLWRTDPRVVGRGIRALGDQTVCREGLVSYSCLLLLQPIRSLVVLA